MILCRLRASTSGLTCTRRYARTPCVLTKKQKLRTSPLDVLQAIPSASPSYLQISVTHRCDPTGRAETSEARATRDVHRIRPRLLVTAGPIVAINNVAYYIQNRRGLPAIVGDVFKHGNKFCGQKSIHHAAVTEEYSSQPCSICVPNKTLP